MTITDERQWMSWEATIKRQVKDSEQKYGPYRDIDQSFLIQCSLFSTDSDRHKIYSLSARFHSGRYSIGMADMYLKPHPCRFL